MAEAKEERWRTAKHQLLAAVQAGVIDIRFSIIHVMEAIHTEERWKPFAVARGHVIRELCGDRCLTRWQDLVLAECCDLALGMSGSPRRANALRTDGLWFGTIPSLVEGLRKTLRYETKNASDLLRSKLRATGLPRHERQRLVRRVFPGGRLSQPLLNSLAANADRDELRRFSEQWHLGEEIWRGDLPYRFARGAAGVEQLAQHLQGRISSVPDFIDFFYEQAKELEEIFGLIRSFGTTIMSSAEELRTAAAELASLGGIALARAKIDEMIRSDPLAETRARVLAALLNIEREEVRRRGVSQSMWQTKVQGATSFVLPALDSILQAMRDYIRDSVVSRPHRKLRRSDGGDLFHLGYIPYVDWFRCDGVLSLVVV